MCTAFGFVRATLNCRDSADERDAFDRLLVPEATSLKADQFLVLFRALLLILFCLVWRTLVINGNYCLKGRA